MKQNDSAYWNRIGESYASEWTHNGRKYVSNQETLFLKTSIEHYVDKKSSLSALDLGSGAGRMLSVLEDSRKVNALIGVDFSEEMLSYCRKKFVKSNKIKKFIRYDISKKLPFADKTFDVVSSFRAIKYNANWKSIIKECNRILKKGGIFIFDMPNINSINRLSKIEVTIHKTTSQELKQTLEKSGFEILRIRGGPILPGALYDKINNSLLLNLTMGIEKLFKTFGETFLSRFLYVACRKV